MKNHLCKCLNCDSILIDENPQINAPELETSGTELNMIWDESKNAWVCPNCKTDDCLIDLPHPTIK